MENPSTFTNLFLHLLLTLRLDLLCSTYLGSSRILWLPKWVLPETFTDKERIPKEQAENHYISKWCNFNTCVFLYTYL